MGYKCEFNNDKTIEGKRHFDLLIIDINQTLEIKNDEYSKKSGNIAIEYRNCKSDKPSGIEATKADIWCHIFNDKPFIVRTDVLKQFIKDNKPIRIIKQGGDKNADMYLYKIEDIECIFIPLENINEIFS